MSGTGQVLYRKAKTLLPGGTQLLSKRPEMFLPDGWPSYYSAASGVEVRDLDGRRYIDMSYNGIGACVLGAADPDVNAAVHAAVDAGSMSTLNAPEEVELAELLCELHPWARMARYARCGGEAMAVAVRIARAKTRRDQVAVCGYHGWHDWYLAANLGDSSNLDGQLLPGLEPLGVPRELRDTAIPFHYNQLGELESIVQQYPDQIGAIIMEPERGTSPAPGFLEGVRRIADKSGAVLIFDEITSGFRMNIGGIHMRYGVSPDIAVFGKAMGNGYPVSAIIGRRSIMEAAQNTFISSTFWTERIGFTAALATIRKMEKYDVPSKLIDYGAQINRGWAALAQKHRLEINISGIPPLTHITFVGKHALALQTLYTQEMLSMGFLLGAAVYTTHAYSDEIISLFHEKTDASFLKIRQAVDSDNIQSFLKNGIAHAGFRRLTA
jgi:glutamate-1-semialdehyde 2,1-aminomutase